MMRIGKSLRRPVLAGALILVVGIIAFKAGQEGLSNFYAQTVYQQMGLWSTPNRRFRSDEASRTAGYLAEALRYAPDSAWALEQMGALHLNRMRVATDPQLAVAAARSAYAHFRRALTERPSAPLLWADVALAKFYLDETDEEFVEALQMAEELGPWESDVLEIVVFSGLAAWSKLDAGQRSAIVEATRRGARVNAAKIAAIAKGFGRLDLICAIAETRSIEARDCAARQNKG